MMKLLLLCVLVSFLSCNQGDPCQQQESQKNSEMPVTTCPEPTPEPTPDPLPDHDHGEVPNEALTFDAEVSLFEFDKDDEDKVLRAIEIIKKVVGSKEFRNRVLNYTYEGKKQFVDNKGMSNEEIYQVLLEGREELVPVVDNKMNLELELYYSWRNTVGYTTPGELRVYMNRKFFDPYTPSEVAGNVFHEWLHKLGFDHAKTYSVRRDSSVPYALGYIIEELGKEYE